MLLITAASRQAIVKSASYVRTIVARRSITLSRSFAGLPGRGCSCDVDQTLLQYFINIGDRVSTKTLLSQHCNHTITYLQSWSVYAVGERGDKYQSACKVHGLLQRSLVLPLKIQRNVIVIDIKDVVDLSAFGMEPGMVTLAGEGGAIAGKEEYWRPVFDVIDKERGRSLHIISVGGGTGDDGVMISALFASRGYDVITPIIVDPNLLAGWLSKNKGVHFYVATAQRFFSKYFERQEDGRYIFHLGTLLNVVSEYMVIEILRMISNNMKSDDILSVLVVDESQFAKIAREGKVECRKIPNPAGLVHYVQTGTNKHYKTVIQNKKMFVDFCAALGLLVIDIDVTKQEAKGIVQVTFMAFKGAKT